MTSINDLNIVICDERLIRVTKVKILGVFFDDRFVSDQHINCLSKNRPLIAFKAFSTRKKTLDIVYNSVVLQFLIIH
jgi:hypothetical protein